MSNAHRWIAAAALLLAALPGHALYKVVGPDGKVTYTDRPPESEGKTAPLAVTRTGPDPSLPYELRQVVARYPVTYYAGVKCTLCDEGRKWLRARGIPFVERTVETDEDAQALSRLVGARELPAMTIGSQQVRGFAPEHWGELFDAAGYPRTSLLPPSYRQPAPEPLVARTPSAPAEAAPAPRELPPAPSDPTAIRF
jgi:glutaredoxin